MKKFILLPALLLLLGTARSQYVTIPDTNFMYFLQALVPNCMNGNQLNTGCSDIQNITTMDCSGLSIADISGVENFAALDTLICGYNNIQYIFQLPNNLSYLDVQSNQLTSLPNLPPLQTLLCSFNQLNQLPYFYGSYLDCSYNQLTDLSGLGGAGYLDCSVNWLTSIDSTVLEYTAQLNCSNNQLTSITFGYSNYLEMADCSYNQLTSMNAISESLISLNCDNNSLTSLPALPDGLNTLTCNANSLAGLPALPASLQYLYCDGNQLTSLPAFDSSLVYVECEGNRLTTVPAITQHLITLDCNNNRVTTLPALTAPLNVLYCGHNQLTALPTLPGSLGNLQCEVNPITALPALANLSSLTCDSTSITALPTLPVSLTSLSCRGVAVPVLPALNNMQNLYCGSPQLTGFTGQLPATLGVFWCENTQLTQMPSFSTLTRYIVSLYLDNNPKLTSLAVIPQGTYILSLNNDSALNSLPDAPAAVFNQFWAVNDTSLHCLPVAKQIVYAYLTGSGIKCLPDYSEIYQSTPAKNTYQLCNAASGCNIEWNLAGRTYYDANKDCTFNYSDIGEQNIKLQLYQSGVLQQQAYSITGGLYSMQSPALGDYQLTVDTTGLPFTILCPTGGVYNDTLTGTDSLQSSDDFAFTCKPGFDIGVQSISIPWGLPVVRQSELFVVAGDMSNFYGAHCASGTAGTVTMSLTGPAAFISEAGTLAPTSLDTNTVVWTVADFGTVDVLNDFNVNLRPHPLAKPGDQVCITVTVTPTGGDNNPANNTLSQCFDVLSSFDPNGKEASPANNVDTGGWITYTIHFQNTGNDTAFNITVLDTLDSHFNLSTFQLLAYSGKIKTAVSQSGIVQFTFSNINLPDSTETPTGSIGYVQYKIKLQTGLAEGVSVSNTASIYFDLNPPVQTNTTLTTIGASGPSGVTTLPTGTGPQVSLYPNPSVGNWQLAVDNSLVGSALEVYDEQGRLVFNSELRTQNSELNLNVASGVYYLRISNGNISVVRKLVKL